MRESIHEHSHPNSWWFQVCTTKVREASQQPTPGIRATGLPKGSLQPWPGGLLKQSAQILAKSPAILVSSDISSPACVSRERELGAGQTLRDADQPSLFNCAQRREGPRGCPRGDLGSGRC